MLFRKDGRKHVFSMFSAKALSNRADGDDGGLDGVAGTSRMGSASPAGYPFRNVSVVRAL